MQLNIFFPIHYKAGNRVEAALRSAASLNRQQVIILWTIAAQGIDGQQMSRKMVERTLQNWLEITSSSVSKAIRSLTDAPLNLLTITEHPDSGREKIVRLTRKGQERSIDEMLTNGETFLSGVIAELSDEEIDMVVYIFKRTHEIFKKYPGPFRETEPFHMIEK
jgi:DNA-binding MarR family transcriptional regulator